MLMSGDFIALRQHGVDGRTSVKQSSSNSRIVCLFITPAALSASAVSRTEASTRLRYWLLIARPCPAHRAGVGSNEIRSRIPVAAASRSSVRVDGFTRARDYRLRRVHTLGQLLLREPGMRARLDCRRSSSLPPLGPQTISTKAATPMAPQFPVLKSPPA
jgi:hypothetical protein